MPDTIPTFPGRFREVARFYTTGRPTYPALLAPRVAQLVGGVEQGRVLDLGTGPGFLALDFFPLAREVIGIDPEPSMLEEARRNAADIGFAIRLEHGSSDTLGDDLAPLRLVSIGRAFHWMDRAKTLRRLDPLIERGGALALFSETYPNVPQNAWRAAFDAVVARYAAGDPAGEHLRAATDHDPVLLASAFSHIERVAVLERRHTKLERFVDRALSFAKTWAGNLDTPPVGLAEDIAAALTPFATDGVIEEVLEGRATVARRPGDLD